MSIETKNLQKLIGKTGVLSGKWHNQHNSEIDLCIEDDGYVSGTFTTKIEGKDSPEVFSLTGFASNDVLAFCVAFRKYGSVTSWTGQLASVSEGAANCTIQALWHMALDLGGRADVDLWRGTLSGFDVYKKGPADEEPQIEDMLPPSHPWWREVSDVEPEAFY